MDENVNERKKLEAADKYQDEEKHPVEPELTYDLERVENCGVDLQLPQSPDDVRRSVGFLRDLLDATFDSEGILERRQEPIAEREKKGCRIAPEHGKDDERLSTHRVFVEKNQVLP